MKTTKTLQVSAAVAATLLFLGAGCFGSTPAKTPVNNGPRTSTPKPSLPAGQQAGANTNTTTATNTPPAQPPAGSTVSGGVTGGGTVTTPTPAPPAGQTPPTTSAPSRTISLTAQQFSFTPASITVKQGERIRLNIKNNDVTHGFFVPGLNINVTLPPGQTTAVDFTADKKGEFSFSCNVFCGEGHGRMTGTIIVE